jgi:hypothetical protein
LSHLTASAGATYRYKPSGGYAGTWYEGNLTGVLLQHQDSDLRDGGIVGFSVSAGRNFTDRIIGRVAYRYEIRRGWGEDVFDTDNHRFSGNLDYRLTERLTFYGTFAWQTGEVVSTATPSPKVLGASEARAPDEALSNGTGLQRVAYRLDAESFTGELGMNIALKRNVAMDISALHFRAYGEDDNDYNGLILRGGLLYRF